MFIPFSLSLFFECSISLAYGGEWEYLHADQKVIYYYDRKSTRKESKSHVSVWMKGIPTQLLSREYERMYQLEKEPYYLFLQILMNCKEKRYAIQQWIFYDQDDSIISSYSFKNNLEWVAISLGTSLGVLYEKICD